MSDPIELQGARILVTGASTGVGRAEGVATGRGIAKAVPSPSRGGAPGRIG